MYEHALYELISNLSLEKHLSEVPLSAPFSSSSLCVVASLLVLCSLDSSPLTPYFDLLNSGNGDFTDCYSHKQLSDKFHPSHVRQSDLLYESHGFEANGGIALEIPTGNDRPFTTK